MGANENQPAAESTIDELRDAFRARRQPGGADPAPEVNGGDPESVDERRAARAARLARRT